VHDKALKCLEQLTLTGLGNPELSGMHIEARPGSRHPVLNHFTTKQGVAEEIDPCVKDPNFSSKTSKERPQRETNPLPVSDDFRKSQVLDSLSVGLLNLFDWKVMKTALLTSEGFLKEKICLLGLVRQVINRASLFEKHWNNALHKNRTMSKPMRNQNDFQRFII
jgi:hypothetical protein